MATPPGGRDPQDGPDYSDIKKRLDKLGGKLDQVKSRDAPQSEADNAARGKAMSLAFRMATELVAGVFVGAIFGWAFDSWLGTAPILLIVFLLLGVAAALFNSVRAAQKMQKKL